MPSSVRLGLQECSLPRLVFLAGLHLAALFVFVASVARQPGAFNSDDLYCLSVCEDLLQGRDVQGWHFTDAPFLFPDLILMLPCAALSSNLVVVFLAYNFLVYNLFAIVLTWIVRLTGPGWRQSFAAACAGVLFLLAAHLHPAYYLPQAAQMYQPGYHVGAVLAGLMLTALLLQGLRHGVGKKTAVAILVVAALAAYSDRLFLPQFVGPLFAVLGLLVLTRAAPRGRLFALGSLLGAGTLLSGGIRWGFERMGLFQHHLTINILTPRLEQIGPFFREIVGCMPHQPLRQVLLLLYLAVGLTVLLYWLWKRPSPSAQIQLADPMAAVAAFDRSAVLLVATALILSPLCNVTALFLAGCHISPPLDRYLFPCWLLPFLFLGLFVQFLTGRGMRWAGLGIRLAVVLFALYRIGVSSAAMDFSNFDPPYPHLAQALDRLVHERGPMRGLAGYWVARRMDFLTRQRVPVRPVLQDCSPFFHAYNPNRFLFDEPADLRLPRYNFIIVSPSTECVFTPHPENVRQEFGEPEEIIAVDGDEIWLYERLSSPRFDRFLESQLAQRLCRRAPYVAPASPAVLGQPKPNQFRWWSARNVRPSLEEELEVRFDPPVRGELIDVGANYGDEYLLSFCRGKELLATLEVPTVPWTGALDGYTAPGIQSRLLRVPGSLRGRRWDRVLVRPIGPSIESRCLGHFLVFEVDVRNSLPPCGGGRGGGEVYPPP